MTYSERPLDIRAAVPQVLVLLQETPLVTVSEPLLRHSGGILVRRAAGTIGFAIRDTNFPWVEKEIGLVQRNDGLNHITQLSDDGIPDGAQSSHNSDNENRDEQNPFEGEDTIFLGP